MTASEDGLSRIFGFGNWHVEVLGNGLVFEQPEGHGVVVCYRARVRLTIRDGLDESYCEDVSTGVAQNRSHAEAHAEATRAALSTAIKRCAINLADARSDDFHFQQWERELSG